MKDAALNELDLTVLRVDLTEYQLVTGDVGTVVFVHGAGQAYEVEFMTADGRTLAVVTLEADHIRPLAGK